MKYHRAYMPGGTYFFTVVTYQRRPILATPYTVDVLRKAFRYTMERLPFTIVASVILPDHMHFIWTLPQETSDFSTRWRLIKSHFTRNWAEKDAISESISRLNKGEKDVWQRRFWEHTIWNDEDLAKHVDYIHFNPVKHGLVKQVKDWRWSSFHRYVREGFYDLDWGQSSELGMEISNRD